MGDRQIEEARASAARGEARTRELKASYAKLGHSLERLGVLGVQVGWELVAPPSPLRRLIDFRRRENPIANVLRRVQRHARTLPSR